MGRLNQAVSRLRARSELEKELEENIVGTEFHLPIFDTEEKQRLRQAPDKDELHDKLYVLPDPANVRFEHENKSYQIGGISVKEKNNLIYKLKHMLGKTDYQGWVEITINTGEEPLPAGLTRHPHCEKMDSTIRYRIGDTEAMLTYEYGNLDQIGDELYLFNLIVTSCWEQPETISEIREDLQKWEVFNHFKEQTR